MSRIQISDLTFPMIPVSIIFLSMSHFKLIQTGSLDLRGETEGGKLHF